MTSTDAALIRADSTFAHVTVALDFSTAASRAVLDVDRMELAECAAHLAPVPIVIVPSFGPHGEGSTP